MCNSKGRQTPWTTAEDQGTGTSDHGCRTRGQTPWTVNAAPQTSCKPVLWMYFGAGAPKRARREALPLLRDPPPAAPEEKGQRLAGEDTAGSPQVLQLRVTPPAPSRSRCHHCHHATLQQEPQGTASCSKRYDLLTTYGIAQLIHYPH